MDTQEQTQSQPTVQTAPAAAVNEGQLSSPWRRLGAVALEVLVAYAPAAVIYFAFGIGGESLSIPQMIGTVIFALYFIAFVVIQIMLMVKRGQTIGKYLLNIYVVDDRKQKKVGFAKYLLLRTILGQSLIGAIPVLGFLYGLVDSLFIFRSDHKTIHDLIAQTKVYYVPAASQRKSLFDFTPIQ